MLIQDIQQLILHDRNDRYVHCGWEYGGQLTILTSPIKTKIALKNTLLLLMRTINCRGSWKNEENRSEEKRNENRAVRTVRTVKGNPKSRRVAKRRGSLKRDAKSSHWLRVNFKPFGLVTFCWTHYPRLGQLHTTNFLRAISTVTTNPRQQLQDGFPPEDCGPEPIPCEPIRTRDQHRWSSLRPRDKHLWLEGRPPSSSIRQCTRGEQLTH